MIYDYRLKYKELNPHSSNVLILMLLVSSYFKELADKYSPGAIIADVPSNTTGKNIGIFEKNKGKTIQGQMYLEVPVQNRPIPKSVLEYAKYKNIQIKDINGKIYN